MYSGEGKETEAGLEAAFEAADFIVEGEYHTGAQEQLYIENNGVIAECFPQPVRRDRKRVRPRLDAVPFLSRACVDAGLQPA